MRFRKGAKYSRLDLHQILGGDLQSYLPHKEGKILYGAFTHDDNPQAPDVVLVGQGPGIEAAAELFLAQAQPVPVFVKRDANQWEYCGLFHVAKDSREPELLDDHTRRVGRPVRRVLYLEEIAQAPSAEAAPA